MIIDFWGLGVMFVLFGVGILPIRQKVIPHANKNFFVPGLLAMIVVGIGLLVLGLRPFPLPMS